jgi:hypothetical protein
MTRRELVELDGALVLQSTEPIPFEEAKAIAETLRLAFPERHVAIVSGGTLFVFALAKDGDDEGSASNCEGQQRDSPGEAVTGPVLTAHKGSGGRNAAHPGRVLTATTFAADDVLDVLRLRPLRRYVGRGIVEEKHHDVPGLTDSAGSGLPVIHNLSGKIECACGTEWVIRPASIAETFVRLTERPIVGPQPHQSAVDASDHKFRHLLFWKRQSSRLIGAARQSGGDKS